MDGIGRRKGSQPRQRWRPNVITLEQVRPNRQVWPDTKGCRCPALLMCERVSRHPTTATKMAEVGVPESTMLALTGHVSRVMLERYSHIRMAAKRDAVRALESPKPVPKIVVPKKVPAACEKTARRRQRM